MGQTAAAAGTPPLERIPRDRTASLELVRITEAAAIAAAHWMGHGNNTEADQAAVEAMRKSMEDARFNGTVVIGEGERDAATGTGRTRRRSKPCGGSWTLCR